MRPPALPVAGAVPVTVAVAVVTAASAALSLLSAEPAAAAAAPHPSVITRSAHVAFENCNARHVILSVTVPRHAFTPGELVTYTVRLTNTGTATCGQAPAQIPQDLAQARHSLTVGPCGTLSTVVRNARGVNVYPGSVGESCPAEFGFRLGPHSSTSTTGSWNQTDFQGHGQGQASPTPSMQAPPGTYWLVVDQAVTLPVTLVPG